MKIQGAGLVVLGLSLGGCPAEPPKAPPPPPKEPVAASQPGSQPGSATSMPDDHTTSSTALTLEDLFKMPEGPEVIAKVNDIEIKRSELEPMLRQTQLQLSATGAPAQLSRYKVLDGAVQQLVDQKLMHVLADKLKVKPDPEYAKAWLADLENRMKADKTFEVFLLRAGKDAAQRKRDSEEAAIHAAIAQKVREETQEQLDADAKAYYERNKKQYVEYAGRQTWRLFIKAPRGMVQRDRDIAKTRIDDLFKRAKKTPTPKNFANLVKSHSEGGKVQEGGYIGWVAKGTFVKELEDRIFATKKNTVLLHEDASGYYLYFIGDERPERTKPFKEVRQQILGQIYRTKVDKEVKKRLADLRDSVKVEIMLPELAELKKLEPPGRGPNKKKTN